MHCVSLVQSTTISVLALWVMYADEERKTMNLEERMWGYTGAAGMVQALATGYFLFDLSVMIRYLEVFGVGMLTHASSCLLTYTLGFVRFTRSVLDKTCKHANSTSAPGLQLLWLRVYAL
jgi:TLC domain